MGLLWTFHTNLSKSLCDIPIPAVAMNIFPVSDSPHIKNGKGIDFQRKLGNS